MNEIIKNLSTKEIIEQFEITETMKVSAELVAVRGAYMDELDKRDHAAFELWMDDENFCKSPREFFIK